MVDHNEEYFEKLVKLALQHSDAPPPHVAAMKWGMTAPYLLMLLLLGLPAMMVSPEMARRLATYVSKKQLSILGITVSIEDRNEKELLFQRRLEKRGRIYIHLNQITLLEGLIYLTDTLKEEDHYFVFANVEYLLHPFLGGWANFLSGAEPVVRQWSKQAQAALDRGKNRVRNGESMVISAEGRRSIDGKLGKYKRGSAVLAIETQCDIIPFLMVGGKQRFPYGEWRVRPGHLHIIFFPAISTKNMQLSDRFALTDQLRALAETELAKIEKIEKEEISKQHCRL